MKILFVIRDMVIGGAGKQLALTANALSRMGHKVFIFAYFGGKNEHLLDTAVSYIAQNPVPKSKINEYLLAMFHIRKQMKMIKPDVAISWRCNAGCFTRLAAFRLPLKVVFSERSDPYTETSLALKVSAFIASFSDGGVFQTEAVRKYYKHLYSKSIVIPNPFDENLSTGKVLGYNKRKLEIVHVARMVISQKRQDLMLLAFKIFLEKYPDYCLMFYGDGPDLECVRSFAKNLGVEKNTIFCGDVVGAASRIGNAKLLVLTSDYEGIPNVIMEAFAMDVPVVSTDCSPGGARVLIDDGENGFIVPAGEAKKLAQKMCSVVENECLAEKFIEKGKEKLKLFEPSSIFQKWNEYLVRFV